MFKKNLKIKEERKKGRKHVTRKHSRGRKFQGLAVPGKNLLTQKSLQHLGTVTTKSCNLLQKQVALQ